jgi:hypothetical protein
MTTLTTAASAGEHPDDVSLDAPPAPRPCRLARGYSHEQMTWREIMILAAISALLAAAITVAVRIVIENLTF